jgi:small conductance mechanosensitive channel
MFASFLRTPDNVVITLGNSAIMGGTIKNFSRADTRRVNLVFGIAYTDDIGKALQVMLDTAAADGKRILKDPAVSVGVDSLGASEVNLFCRPWCRSDDYWAVRGDMTRRVKEAFDSAGISIPFPQRDVHVIRDGADADSMDVTLIDASARRGG